MANYPVVTYSNLKHKVTNGISGGVIQTRDEAINVIFSRNIGILSTYLASFNAPYNEITGTLNSTRELTQFKVMVTPAELDDYGPNVGNRATIITGISANTNTNFTIPITQAVFSGSSTNTYRICLLAQSSLDLSWDCTQLFMVIDTNTSFTNTYTEVEYLECTGTQYINTNVTYANNLQILDTISYTSLDFNGVAYVINGIDQTVYWGLINQSGNYYFTCGGHSTIIPIVNQKYNLKIDTNTKSLYLDDTLIATRTAGINGSGNMYLFATKTYNAISTSYFSKNMRRYACKFYQNGALIRDFIPCIRSSDNKPGMYDRVNNVFYTNQGSGEFKYGPLKSVPQTYQQIEYVQNTAQQHIDTLVSGNNVNLKIYAEYEPTSNSQMAIFSARTGSDNGISFWTDGYCHFGNSSTRISGVVSTGKHKVELSKNGLWWDGTKLNFTAGSSMANSNLVLFRVLGDSRVFLGKIYNAKVYDNNILIRNLVPCYRKSDNVIGMLDLVNNQFYTNAGSGTFAKGNNVNNYNYIKYTPTDYDGYEVHNWN